MKSRLSKASTNLSLFLLCALLALVPIALAAQPPGNPTIDVDGKVHTSHSSTLHVQVDQLLPGTTYWTIWNQVVLNAPFGDYTMYPEPTGSVTYARIAPFSTHDHYDVIAPAAAYPVGLLYVQCWQNDGAMWHGSNWFGVIVDQDL